MRIVIVSPYAPPEKGAPSIRIDSFRKGSQGKHEFHILAPMRNGLTSIRGVTRYRGIREMIHILSRLRPDVVLGTSPPMTHSFFAQLYCKIKGIPFVLDVRDPWVYAIKQLHLYAPTNMKLSIYSLIEKATYLISDKIFIVTPYYLKFLPPRHRKKAVVVTNGSNTDIIRRDKKKGAEIRKQLGIPLTATVFLYMGAIAKKELDLLIQVMVPHLQKGAHLLLLVITEERGAKKTLKDYLAFSERLRVKNNIHVVESITYENVYKYASASDIGLNPIPSTLNFNIPVKVYDYLACNIPVMTKGPKEGALKELVETFDIGSYATSWKEFEKHLTSILKDPSTFLKKGIQGRSIVQRHFNRKQASKKAIQEMEGLVI